MNIHACAPNSILDIGSWTDTAFAEHGATLTCAIRYFARVTLHPAAKGKIVIHGIAHRHDQKMQHCRLEDITLSEFIVAAARFFEVPNFAILLRSDLPPGCGTGSMAATRVAIVGAIARYAGKCLSPLHIALIAHRLQHEELCTGCGLHSFMAAACGGIALYRFDPFPRVFAMHLPVSTDEVNALQRRCLLVQTGRHIVRNIYARLEKRYFAGEHLLLETLWKLRKLPEQAMRALCCSDWPTLGTAMLEHTLLHQQVMPALSMPEVRHINSVAHRHGALATMVNGAGGSVTILSALDDNTRMENELRESGYPVLPLHIARMGLSVWTADPARFQPAFPHYHTFDVV